MIRWWRRRSLRARLTVLATTVLALGLTIGTLGLAVLFTLGRVADLDRQLGGEAGVLAQLVGSDQLTQPLPVPPGSPLLAQVIDPAGTVLASSASAGMVLPLVPAQEVARLAAAGSETVEEAGFGAGSLRVVVVSSELRGTSVHVVVAASVRDLEATGTALRRVLLVVVPLVVLAAGLSAWLAIGSALAPVEDLRAAAERVGSSTARVLPVPPTDDEIARLATTLNQMLARLDAAAQQQRQFASDAAHELRSPLACVTTEIEVALAGSVRGDDQWRTTASDVLVEARRLAGVVDDLLLLSRAESGQPVRLETVDLAAVVAGFADLEDADLADDGVGDPSAASPVRISVEAPTDPVLVSGDQAAIERAVRNLVDNARQHARAVVLLALEPGIGGAPHQIVVTDDGPGIPPAELDRVFDRFHRLDPSRSRPGGAGLGLTIVRGIARTHGGDATAETAAGGGGRLRLSLPSSPPVR